MSHSIARALLRSFAVICLLYLNMPLPAPMSAAVSATGHASGISVDFGQFAQEPGLQEAVTEALQIQPSALLTGNQFAVLSEARSGDWLLISVASLNGRRSSSESYGASDSARLILARRDSMLGWQAAMAGTRAYSDYLAMAPASLVAPDAKALLDPLAASTSVTASSIEYKFPWAEGDWGYWNSDGWHDSPAGLDFGTGGADKRVLASAGGVITSMCTRGTQTVNVSILDDSGVTLQYWHIDKNQVASGITVGKRVARGRVLGTLKSGTVDPYDGCGRMLQRDSNAHIHWIIPTDRPFTVDGWTITYAGKLSLKRASSRAAR